MTRLDPKLTAELQNWLNSTDKDASAGADLCLRVTRNRALSNSYRLRPEKYQAKVEYELRKHLRMRLDNMAVADVVELEKEVMPRVEAIISTSDELPKGEKRYGRRADHDSLPEEIRALWEENTAGYRRVVLLFNELKAMSDMQPCDRYEKLKMMDEAERSCREALERYDSYDPSAPVSQKRSADPETVKAVSAARKSLSKYRKIIAQTEPGTERYSSALAKIEAAVSVIASSGAGFTDGMIEELKALGIRL